MKIIFFLLLLFSQTVFATSYQVRDKCFAPSTWITSTNNAAISYYIQNYPLWSGNAQISIDTGSGHICNMTSAGYVTCYVNYLSNTGTYGNVLQTFQLPTCDATVITNLTEQNIIITLATVFLFVFGFNVGRSFSARRGQA